MSKPAFPRPVSSASNSNRPEDCIEFEYGQDGMSLLEFYAGQALKRIPFWRYFHRVFKLELTARLAFDQAEFMIKEARERVTRGEALEL